MKLGNRAVMATLFLLTFAGAASAEEQFGVTVYAGAKAAPAVAKSLKEMMPDAEAFCYTTPDSVEKVVAFYKTQKLQYMGGDKEAAMFRRGHVDVSVQNPWMDTQTGKLTHSTLISIVRHKQ